MSLYKLHKRIGMIKLYGASVNKCMIIINSTHIGKRLPARIKARLAKERISSSGFEFVIGYKGHNKYLKKCYERAL